MRSLPPSSRIRSRASPEARDRRSTSKGGSRTSSSHVTLALSSHPPLPQFLAFADLIVINWTKVQNMMSRVKSHQCKRAMVPRNPLGALCWLLSSEEGVDNPWTAQVMDAFIMCCIIANTIVMNVTKSTMVKMSSTYFNTAGPHRTTV